MQDAISPDFCRQLIRHCIHFQERARLEKRVEMVNRKLEKMSVVDEAVRLYERAMHSVVLLLSNNSTPVVLQEIERTIRREELRQQRRRDRIEL